MSYFTSGSSITKLEAYISATGLTLSSMLSVVLHQLYFFYGHRTGMHMRIATTGCIYRKASVDMGVFAIVLFNLAINIVEEAGNRSKLVNHLVPELLT